MTHTPFGADALRMSAHLLCLIDSIISASPWCLGGITPSHQTTAEEPQTVWTGALEISPEHVRPEGPDSPEEQGARTGSETGRLRPSPEGTRRIPEEPMN
jgi:hypothetical protein